MVNYVCRTCLYVSHNEFSFKKLEKVKDALENYVPEIKNFLGSNCIVCEQCYQFLKCMKKFREKCIESQNRMCSFNVNNIIENTDRAIAEARWQLHPPPSYTSQSFNSVQAIRGTKRSPEQESVINFASTKELTSQLFGASTPNTIDSATDLTSPRNKLNTSTNSIPSVQKRHRNSVIKKPNSDQSTVVDLSVKSLNSSTAVLRRLRRSKNTETGRVPTAGPSSVQANDNTNDNTSKIGTPGTTPKSSKITRTSNVCLTPKTIANLTAPVITLINIKNDSISIKDTPKGVQKKSPILNTKVPPEMPILTCNDDDDSDLEIVEIDDEDGADGNTVELKIRRKSVGIADTGPDITAVLTSDDSCTIADDNSGNDNVVESNNNDVACDHHNEFEDMPVLTKIKEEAPEEPNPGWHPNMVDQKDSLIRKI